MLTDVPLLNLNIADADWLRLVLSLAICGVVIGLGYRWLYGRFGGHNPEA